MVKGVYRFMVQLSKRLKEVAGFVEEQAILADIGSDHAYLPAYLVKKGKIQKAIAGEVVKGPFDSAVKNVQKEGLEQLIEVRLANGLRAIEKNDDIDTVTIAGMGGTLISTILEEGKDRLTAVKRLITQPNIHALAIRMWAVENGWKIVAEAILEEDEKIYEVVVLERGKVTYSDKELLLGPFLMRERNAVFRKKWLREMKEWHRILQSIEAATKNPATEEKRVQLQQQIQYVQEVLTI